MKEETTKGLAVLLCYGCIVPALLGICTSAILIPMAVVIYILKVVIP
jgi:hypothetical protein